MMSSILLINVCHEWKLFSLSPLRFVLGSRYTKGVIPCISDTAHPLLCNILSFLHVQRLLKHIHNYTVCVHHLYYPSTAKHYRTQIIKYTPFSSVCPLRQRLSFIMYIHIYVFFPAERLSSLSP